LLPLCRNVDYFSRDVSGYRDAATAAMSDETFLSFFRNKFPIVAPITALCRTDDKGLINRGISRNSTQREFTNFSFLYLSSAREGRTFTRKSSFACPARQQWDNTSKALGDAFREVAFDRNSYSSLEIEQIPATEITTALNELRYRQTSAKD